LSQLPLVDAIGPGIERLERHKEFGIEEAGGIGSVIGSSIFRDDRYRLRKSLDDAAHSIDIAVCLLERDGGREGRAYPQVSFLELGQELQTERRQRDCRKSEHKC